MGNTLGPILVIGHRNPDTDSIASAVGYAWLLNTGSRDGQAYIAGRTGKVNAQTAFALEHFGVEAPILVADVWGRVSDLAEALPSLRNGQKLLEACQSVPKTQRPAPILNEDDQPLQLLTAAGLFGNLPTAFDSLSAL